MYAVSLHSRRLFPEASENLRASLKNKELFWLNPLHTCPKYWLTPGTRLLNLPEAWKLKMKLLSHSLVYHER